jgi:hypothetical protein
VKFGPRRASAGERAAKRAHRRTEHRVVSAAIYGLVVSAAVMATAGDHLTVFQVAISVLVTVFTYWIAESYSEILAREVIEPARITRAEVAGLLRDRWPLVEASYIPLLAALLARLFGASPNTSINVGLATATILLGGFGMYAAVRRGSGWVGRLTASLVTASFGMVMIVLKAALGH